MPRRGSLRIRLYHARLRGGRLDISADTLDEKVRDLRVAALEGLMERGDWHVIEWVRKGLLDLSDVQRAARTHAWDSLQPKALPTPKRKASAVDLSVGGILEAALRRAKGTRAMRTHRQYSAYATQVLAYFGADRDAATITTAEAEAFLHRPQPSNGGKVWSPRSQRGYAMFAGGAWNRAIQAEAEAAELDGHRRERIRRNPWRTVQLPAAVATRHAFLHPADWLALARVVAGTPRLGLYATACLAGLRQQEVAHLRPGLDVDLTARMIRVQPRRGDREWRTKNPRGVREVPICDELHQVLAEHERLGYSGRRFFFRAAGRDEPIGATTFITWTRQDLKAAGLRYGREAGDSLTYHSFRHTFASWLAQADKSLLLIAELLGDTVETVTKYYAHLMPSNRRAGVAVIDATLRGAE